MTSPFRRAWDAVPLAVCLVVALASGLFTSGVGYR